ncbi:hypothetical protein [Nocardia brasiliensis]|uniref:hypothetical protein n=1 Tax=Nocardia brasiliensis TaxID=37326 RepID=UPI003D8CAACF
MMSGRSDREQRLGLPNPGAGDQDPRQIAYTLFSHAAFSNLVWGRAGIVETFEALSAVAPAYLTAGPKYEWLAEFPRHGNVYWFALTGPQGSGIATLVVSGADTDFTTTELAMPLRELREPWQWGMGVPVQPGANPPAGASVPAGFAEVFASSDLVPLSVLFDNPAIAARRSAMIRSGGAAARRVAQEPLSPWRVLPKRLAVDVGLWLFGLILIAIAGMGHPAGYQPDGILVLIALPLLAALAARFEIDRRLAADGNEGYIAGFALGAVIFLWQAFDSNGAWPYPAWLWWVAPALGVLGYFGQAAIRASR